jgi:hypothetical protein
MDNDGRPLTWFERSGYGSRRAEVNLVSVLFLIFAFITLFLSEDLDLSFALTGPVEGLEDLTNTQGTLALIALFSFFFSSLIVIVSSIYSTGIFSGKRDPMSFILFLLILIFPIGWIYAYYLWTFGSAPGRGRTGPLEIVINLSFILILIVFLISLL